MLMAPVLAGYREQVWIACENLELHEGSSELVGRDFLVAQPGPGRDMSVEMCGTSTGDSEKLSDPLLHGAAGARRASNCVAAIEGT